MSLLDKAVEDSIRKRYIDAVEGERVKKTIKSISAKHGIAEEWIVKMVMVEAEGFNAKRDSGTCVGIVQVCRQDSTVLANGGIKEVGGFEAFKNVGPAKQLDIWDRYHLSHWLKLAKRKPQTQGELMLLNILPARYLDIAAGRLNRDSKMDSAQASFLYTDYDPILKRRTGGGYWSANSASKGMDIKTQQVLGNAANDFIASVTNNISNAANQIGSLTQDAASVISNGLATLQSGIQSALLTGQNCPPPPYTQQDRIIYPGCLQKTNNPIFGNGFGSGASAPGVNAINGQSQGNGSQAASNSEPYNGELKPGGLIVPMKKGSYRFISGFGWRGSRMHAGVDLSSGRLNAPIYAAADGIVIFAGFTDPGGYGSKVDIDHGGGLVTRYAHLETWVVKEKDIVKQGQHIGGEGQRGNSQAIHLHLETLEKGQAVDPKKYINF